MRGSFRGRCGSEFRHPLSSPDLSCFMTPGASARIDPWVMGEPFTISHKVSSGRQESPPFASADSCLFTGLVALVQQGVGVVAGGAGRA